jgi:LAO/AO transport system kinase
VDPHTRERPGVSVPPGPRSRAGDPAELVRRILEGDRRAVARAISLVENRDPRGAELMALVFPHTGRAAQIGFTGPPGSGKSSLISALCRHLRALELTVGVLSVDPTSPFTQGALLGDRIRLAEHYLDPGVYIRSMGTRGTLGGVAEATLQAGLVIDAAGRDVVVYETVGVGQSEIAIAALADVVTLVLMPGSGDSIQALKAGVMEIPDLVVLNKSELPGAKAARAEIAQILRLAEPELRPGLVETSARTGEGVEALWDEIVARRAALEQSGALAERRRASLEREVLGLASARAARRLEQELEGRDDLRELLDRVAAREVDPLRAVAEVLDRVYGIRE